jgi:hypothetical protein
MSSEIIQICREGKERIEFVISEVKGNSGTPDSAPTQTERRQPAATQVIDIGKTERTN